MRHDPPSVQEACIMLCDVSGFVRKANSHHQQHGPKVGAEKTRIWLDSVFEILLQGVEDHHGEVLQFIGDAVVARFPIERALNAARCALHIKDRCSQIQVQIKTGIAAGIYDVYRPSGTSQYSSQSIDQYPLSSTLGPAFERTLQALQWAKHSDVICDDSFLMDSKCQLSQSTEFVAEPLREGFYRLVAQTTNTQPLMATPAQLVQDLEVLNEIKLLTIVYAEVGVPDAQRMQAEWLDALCNALEPLQLEHSATLIGLCQTIKGHRFQYIMGSTKSEFNDVEIAIQMASHIREVIEQHGGAMRASIGYGHAWQGKLGGRQLKLFNAHGREVNLAARILEQAELGQIVLTEGAAQQLNDQLHVVEQGALSIKGEDRLIRIYRVPLQIEIKNQPSRKSNALYGRAHELEKVLSILSTPRPGREPCLIQITGAAGIGKSTFVGGVEQLLQRQGTHTFTLRSSPHSKLLPYSIAYPLLVELGKLYKSQTLENWILQTLSQHEELAEWVGMVGLISPLKMPGFEEAHTASPETKSKAIKKIFKALITQASADFKLLCIVEDLQWFDNASVELMTESVFTSVGLNCIYSIRTSEGNSRTSQLLDRLQNIQPTPTIVQLLPFDTLETEQFLLKWFSVAAVPMPLVNALHKLSEGNLLLICALIQSLLQDGTIRKIMLGEVEVDFRKLEQFTSLPTNMEHALQARMDTLPKPHRMVLSHCSIFKTAFSASEVQSAFQYPDLDWLIQIFAELEQQKFVRSFVSNSGEVRQTFEHQVIEQCVYERIPFEERKALHALFAEWLQSQITKPDAANRNKLTIRLAAQYDWAGQLEKALPLTQDAIRFAFEVGALDEALERIDKLVQWHENGLLPNAPRFELAQLHEKKAHAFYSQGRLQDAIAQYLKALETLGLRLNNKSVLLKQRNYLTLQLLFLKRFIPAFLQGKKQKPTAEVNLIVRTCTNLGELGFVMNKTDEGNFYLLNGVKLVEQFDVTTGDQTTAYSGCVILAQIYNNKRWMEFFKSRLYEALAKLPAGHEKLKALAHIYHRMGYVEYAAARFKRATELIEQGVEAAKLSHEFHTEVLSYQVFIFTRVAEGRFAEALDYYETYEALAKKYASKYFNVHHQYALINQRVYCLAMENRLEEARAQLNFLEKSAREFNFAHFSLVPIQRCKLMVLYREKDWSAARSQAMLLAGMLSDEILNKVYFVTCYSLPMEVLLEASVHQHPLTMDENQTLELLFKGLKRMQTSFELAKPIYLLLEAQMMMQCGKDLTKATRKIRLALEMATHTGQLVEVEKAKRLLTRANTGLVSSGLL